MLSEIALGIWRTFPPILLVFGTIGNIMTIIVLMQRGNRNSSIAKYLTALAVADLIVLWVALPRNWLEYGYGVELRSYSEIICKVQLFLLYFGCHSSALLVVVVTIARFISTWQPMKVKRICTSRNANITLISMVTSLVLFNSHFLYGMGHVKATKGYICYPINDSYAYFIFNILPAVAVLLFSLTPLIIMIVSNISIIIRLLVGRRQSQRLTAVPRKSKSFHITTMLITLNVVYMICVTPLTVFLIFHSDWVLSRGNDQSDDVLELIWAIVNALFYTNSTVNFILYFLSGSTFRKVVKKHFCRKRIYSNIENAI